jgi:hypothetical protein
MIPSVFKDITADPMAVSGILLTVCALLVFAVPEIISQTENYLEIKDHHDRLKGRVVCVSFKGEVFTSSGKTTKIALIPLFWTCHTLQHIKSHIFDSATDIFSVFVMVQICLIIATAGESSDLWEALEHSVAHAPWIEVAALAVFNYVVWRTGAYWRVARDLYQSPVLRGDI